jgi:penicillin-binding protein 1A
VFITKIVDANQQVLENNLPQARRALSSEVAYVMTSLMQGVVQYGTGRSVRALQRPVAAKTGTTNDFRDAWLLGFTPEIITGVWVGIDDRMTLGHQETGGRAASPIWLEFMREAVRGQPVTDFAIPPGVRFFRIDAKSGKQASVATESTTLFEAFIDGTTPEAEEPRADDLRRTIHHWDRRRRSTAQRLDPRFFDKRSAQPGPRLPQESGLQAPPTVDGAN